MRTSFAWKSLVVVVGALVLLSSCQKEPPKQVHWFKAVHDHGNLYNTTMALSDSPGGQGAKTISAKMYLVSVDCTSTLTMAASDTPGGQGHMKLEAVYFKSDTGGGQ